MRLDPAIGLLALGQTLAWASIYYVFPALLLRWERNTDWSKAELTAAITLAVLISAAASPLAGRTIDKGHGAALAGGCAVVGGVGLFLLSLVTELRQFYAVWALIGIAMAGCLYEPIFASVTRSRGGRARRGIIVITLAAGFASTVSFLAVHGLAESLGWRGAVRVGAAIMILLVAPVLWLGLRKLESPVPGPLRPADPVEAAGSFLTRPSFWLLAVGFACLAVTHGAILHHLLPLLDERGLSAEMAVVAASFIGPMQVAGRIAIMASERILSNNGIAITAFGFMSLSVLLLFFSSVSPAFLAIFVILFGSAHGTVSIVRPLLAREILGDSNFGAKSGALAMPFLAGVAISPFAGSIIWNLGGYDLMLGVLMGCTVFGCGLYWSAYRLSRSSASTR
ncbi:MAG: MFS transporter [Paracoccaceae bacterium]|nr:MFS transporter [Paracoccaceae bacterium]